MASIRKIARNLLVWSYERGTVQYDIICILILAFIFFVPRSCFVSQGKERPRPVVQKTQVTTQQSLSTDEKK